MKKKEFLAGTVLLAASSALCLRLMKKVGERLKKQQEKAIEEPRTSLRTIRRALRTIVRENSDEDDWIIIGKIGNLLDKRYTDFDVRNFGFSKLTPFLESLDMFEIKDMKKDSSSPQKYVRLK